jgi:hypothetical protein
MRILSFRGRAEPGMTRLNRSALRGNAPAYSGLMLAVRITLPHFSVSSAMS